MRPLPCAVVLLLFTTQPERAFACLCGSGGPPCQAYFLVDAIFAGTVTAVSPLEPARPYSQRLVRFATVRGFRGVEETMVEVVTASDDGGCGYRFEIGRQYLVYARRGQQGRLTTSICSRTRPLADAAEDLKFFEELRGTPRGARVSGTIKHWERDFATGRRREYPAVPDVPVQLRGPAGAGQASTDEQGRYEISGIGPGMYEVEAFPPPPFSSKDLRLVVEIPDTRACAVADFGLRYDGRVTGVLRSESGQPVSDVTVQAMAAQRSQGPGLAETVIAKTDSAGYYELAPVPPGDYVIGVELESRLRRRENEGEQVYPRTFYPGTPDVAGAAVIRVGEGNRVELEPMGLPAARQRRQLTGVVVWPDGTPVPGASVLLSEGDATGRQVAVGIQTDEQGRFEFAVYDGLSYGARASYSIPDDPARRHALGRSSAFVASEQTPSLRVVVSLPTRR
jgi:hypothetical protein